jgi:hypothetical protein
VLGRTKKKAPVLAEAFFFYRLSWCRVSFILSPGDSSDAPPGFVCFCPGAYEDAPGPFVPLSVEDELSFMLSAGVFSEAPGDLCAYAATAVLTRQVVTGISTDRDTGRLAVISLHLICVFHMTARSKRHI